jgi:hypothetical protein
VTDKNQFSIYPIQNVLPVKDILPIQKTGIGFCPGDTGITLPPGSTFLSGITSEEPPDDDPKDTGGETRPSSPSSPDRVPFPPVTLMILFIRIESLLFVFRAISLTE